MQFLDGINFLQKHLFEINLQNTGGPENLIFNSLLIIVILLRKNDKSDIILDEYAIYPLKNFRVPIFLLMI